jgi:alginate export protein
MHGDGRTAESAWTPLSHRYSVRCGSLRSCPTSGRDAERQRGMGHDDRPRRPLGGQEVKPLPGVRAELPEHLVPALQAEPKLSLLSAVGFQWRETTADVYVQPNIPVRGTAGKPGRWSGMYVQLRAEWAITPNLAGALEAVSFQVGEALRRGGGHDANYLGVELNYGW